MMIRRVYNPSIVDAIEPESKALPGQVVRVLAKAASEGDFTIATLSGDVLGIVNKSSLYPVPKSLKYDPNTGLTEAAAELVC